jgi:hypothetical protein
MTIKKAPFKAQDLEGRQREIQRENERNMRPIELRFNVLKGAEDIAPMVFGGLTDTDALNKVLYPPPKISFEPIRWSLQSGRVFFVAEKKGHVHVGPKNLSADELYEALRRLNAHKENLSRLEDNPHYLESHPTGYRDKDRAQILATTAAIGHVRQRIYAKYDIIYHPNPESPDNGYLEFQREGLRFRGGRIPNRGDIDGITVEVSETGDEKNTIWRAPSENERSLIIDHLHAVANRLESNLDTPVIQMLDKLNAPPVRMQDPYHATETSRNATFDHETWSFRQERSYSDGRTEVLSFRMESQDGKPEFTSTRFGKTQKADLGEMEEIVYRMLEISRNEADVNKRNDLQDIVQEMRPKIEVERKKESLNKRDKLFRFYFGKCDYSDDLVLGVKLETEDDHMSHVYSHTPYSPWGDAPLWAKRRLLDVLTEKDKYLWDVGQGGSEEYALFRRMSQDVFWQMQKNELRLAYQKPNNNGGSDFDITTLKAHLNIAFNPLEKERYLERIRPPEFTREQYDYLLSA